MPINTRNGSIDDTSVSIPTAPKAGRPPNVRVPYQISHPSSKKRCRIIRSSNHRHVANFVGSWFPNDTNDLDVYCATMLMLLKPWRDLKSDLKPSHLSWRQALDAFLADNPKSRYIISNIKYYHDCRIIPNTPLQLPIDPRLQPGIDTLDFDEDVQEAGRLDNPSYTEEGLESLIACHHPWREEVLAQTAIDIAKLCKIFPKNESQWSINTSGQPSIATGNDISNLLAWKSQLRTSLSSIEPNDDNHLVSHTVPNLPPCVQPLSIQDSSSSSIPAYTPDDSRPATKIQKLTFDQKRAIDIIVWHLDQTLQNHSPPPLRLIIYGEGGTGKSVVIQTVTDAFAARGALYLLIKSSYTGIAASLIDGKTCHLLAQISIGRNGKLSEASKNKLQQMWKHARYLIIDEYSMLSKTFLHNLSRNLTIATALNDAANNDHSFGGLNVILCGDLHQFPPVVRKRTEALFYPADIVADSKACQLGRKIYEEFQDVVILKEQKRVVDDDWLFFLRRLRLGKVEQDDLTMLRSLIINPTLAKDAIDFNIAPWNSALLITPRHALRQKWNDCALRKICKENMRSIFVCNARDTIDGKPLSLRQRYALTANTKQETSIHTKILPQKLELAIGMQIMITTNIEVEHDITNGARGEIVDILLHPDEPAIPPNAIVNLKYLPVYILVKMIRTRAPLLDNLGDKVVPIEFASQTFPITYVNENSDQEKKTVTRLQYPITGAYAITDYRAQGQTLSNVIVDIASPGYGKLTLFNLYVALSRSRGRDSIRLLRDFDDKIFNQTHCEALINEDARLEKLHEDTIKRWSGIIGNGSAHMVQSTSF